MAMHRAIGACRCGAVFLLVGIAHVCKKTDRMLKVGLESDLSAKILAK
jgi:hypothetical protein